MFFVDESRNKVVNHNENSQVDNDNSARYREQDNGDKIYLVEALILVEIENAMVNWDDCVPVVFEDGQQAVGLQVQVWLSLKVIGQLEYSVVEDWEKLLDLHWGVSYADLHYNFLLQINVKGEVITRL